MLSRIVIMVQKFKGLLEKGSFVTVWRKAGLKSDAVKTEMKVSEI